MNISRRRQAIVVSLLVFLVTECGENSDKDDTGNGRDAGVGGSAGGAGTQSTGGTGGQPTFD